MHSRSRLIDLVLFLLALLGPAFHLAGFLTRGLDLYYAAYPRLGLTYAMLALSAGAAAFLALRRGVPLVRLIAGTALLVNLGFLAYTSNLWSHDIKRALADATMAPIEAGKLGIVVAPASHGPAAVAEMQAVESAINEILRQNALEPYIVVRRSYPIESVEQAERLGQRLRANIIVWKSDYSPDSPSIDRHVTVLGANETAIDLEPYSLMLLMATQVDFTVRSDPMPDEAGVSPLATHWVAPVAAGFGSLAVGQPLVAAAQFQSVLKASGVPTETVSTLHNYLGTTFLYANRPDLALEQYEGANALGESAYAWVGKGNAYIAQREWLMAVDAFNRALGLDPYSPIPYCGLGITLARERNVTRALATYRQALALEPAWGAPYALFGLACELEANVNGAREAYQACALHAPPNVGLQTAALQRADDVLRHPPTAVPTATPLPKPTPTPVPTEAIYRVQRGDTLRGIADKLGVTPEAIIEINQLDQPNALRVGQLLIIPKKP